MFDRTILNLTLSNYRNMALLSIQFIRINIRKNRSLYHLCCFAFIKKTWYAIPINLLPTCPDNQEVFPLLKLLVYLIPVIISVWTGQSFAADKTDLNRSPAENHIIDIGSRLELFSDKFLIAKMKNTRLVLHQPEDRGPILFFDRPWEGIFSGYCTVIRSADQFQLYYRGLNSAGEDGRREETTAYAESNDGLLWQKPTLKLYELDGIWDNNVVLADATPVSHNFSPFLDTKKDISADQKYKALGGNEKSGLIAYVSADGIHWRKLQEKAVFTKGKFDSQNVAFWSESEQAYLCYFRTWTGKDYGGFRTVSRTTSKDFITWTEPVQMTYGDTPPEHIYVNQTAPYFRAPHIYIALAARFMPGRQVLSDEQAKDIGVNPGYFKDCSDVVLMTSRGGNVYDRTFMEGFINPGIGPQNWVSRSNYPALNIVQTGPAEMSLYVNKDYAQPSAHINRYALRLDGFASVYGPYAGGELLTKPLRFNGNHLVINYVTSAAGAIQVELLDELNQPFPGFSLDESQIIIGNEIERIVSWKNGSDIGNLIGKTVSLRFVMKDAHLYSLRFK